jgi:hypothetical protein
VIAGRPTSAAVHLGGGGGGRHMQLKEMLPEELIDHSWLECYEQQITAIWWQLRRLSSNLFILDKVSAFPFHLFVLEPQPFWELVRLNFFDMSLMIIWRVTLDPGRDVVTLRKLKNEIIRHLQREKYVSELKKVLRSVRFERAISELGPQLREIRTRGLAHTTVPPDHHSNSGGAALPSVSLSELVGLQQTIHRLFEALCFGRGRLVYPLSYHPDVTHPAGMHGRADIERLLDCVARESLVLNMPEWQPQHWVLWRSKLSSESLETLNLYRRRFGLGPA